MTPPVIRPPKPQRLRPSVPAVLALGSNLGDRESTIRQAVADIDAVPGVIVDAVSSLVETPALKPDGVAPNAPRYLNAVLTIHTALEPHDLLEKVNAIEKRHGRVRGERWGDRTLDIDIIDVAGRVLTDDRLTLPHPRAHERGFVLGPWCEIEPDAVLAGLGRVDALLKQTSATVRPHSPPARRHPGPQPDDPGYANDTETNG